MPETKPLSGATGDPVDAASTEALAGELAEARRQIAHLTEEMAPNLRNLVAAHLRHETDQEALSDHLLALTRKLEEMTRERDGLRQELDKMTRERDSLREEIGSMRRSRSWRLTRPVRALSRLVKRA